MSSVSVPVICQITEAVGNSIKIKLPIWLPTESSIVNIFTDVNGRVDFTSEQTTVNNLMAELESKTQAAVAATGSSMTVTLDGEERKEVADITPYLGIKG